MLPEVLQNKLDGVSQLAALVQLMVHLVKLSCDFWPLCRKVLIG